MKESRAVQLVANTILGIAALLALLPFLLLVVASLTDNTWAIANGFTFFPGKWSVEAYLYLANQWNVIGRAYFMSVLVTVVGTSLSMVITMLLAYGISNDEVPGHGIISFMVIFTMLFNGGLVSTYYSYTNVFGIKNTVWALIVPNLLLSAFNVILVKNYFRTSIPDSLLEAARIDGAGEFTILYKIVVPLSKPIMATIGLMTGLYYWNDWQNGLYYLTQRGGGQYFTIQVVLNTINENINFLRSNSGTAVTSITDMPSVTVRMAIVIIGIIPILIAYPFFQQYFVKGITLGGVKE